tara:strand:- start:89 stop:745 length:657 start_codon:yes stop_codon:yes gene_type:complete
MSDVDKILRKLDPDTLPQDMRGMGFSYKILPDLSGKDLRGCVFYNCFPKLDNEDCLQLDAIAVISERHTALDLRAISGSANLKGANLRGANLQWARLQGADLQGADLHDADLRYAGLEGADLQGADLQDADLQDAHLYGANLRGAHLYGANLRGAHLFDANFNGADLRQANLASANLTGATLEGANLEGAIYNDFSVQFLGNYLIKSKNMRHISEVDA